MARHSTVVAAAYLTLRRYESKYSADDVNGVVAKYDPTTKEEITDYAGTITLVLAYSVDGAALPSGDGALRVALVSQAADQITDSKKWAGQVAEIVVE